jgi:hypothetical protein
MFKKYRELKKERDHWKYLYEHRNDENQEWYSEKFSKLMEINTLILEQFKGNAKNFNELIRAYGESTKALDQIVKISNCHVDNHKELITLEKEAYQDIVKRLNEITIKIERK